jgi:hypothetical protein
LPTRNATITLFDWTAGGHHPVYLRRFADAFVQQGASVTVAVPDRLVPALADAGVNLVRLGRERPSLDPTLPLAPQSRALAEAELDLFDQVAAMTGGGHLVHMIADPILRWLVRRPPLGRPVSLLVFRPRAHFGPAYGSSLGAGDALRARFFEHLLRRWRRRRDAHALLTIDEEAATRWATRPGAPAFYVPEPPVGPPPAKRPTGARSGCIVFGSLAPRKGVDLLADAVCLEPGSQEVVLAGPSAPGYERTLDRLAADMRRAGAWVERFDRRLSDKEALELLAGARCVVLPYPRHLGMSRVLLEAAVVGTPVVVHDFGLLGHLVRRHRLGLAVDCNDPRALRDAVLSLTEDAAAGERFGDGLSRFAALHSEEAFSRALWAAFAGMRRAAASRIGPRLPPGRSGDRLRPLTPL